MTLLLSATVEALITILKTERSTEQLGGQLIDATVVRLEPHSTLLDRYVIVLNCTIPYTLDVIECHIVV